MKGNLEVVLIVVLAIGAIALPLLGLSAVQSIESMKASHISWPNLLIASSVLEEGRDRLDPARPETVAEARTNIEEGLTEIQMANWPKTFRAVDSDLFGLIKTLDSNLPADQKVIQAKSVLGSVEKSIVDDSRELVKGRKPRMVAAEARSWMTLLMGLQALLTLVLALYCLQERNKHQKLLTIANLSLEKLNGELEYLSNTDPLTGLLNRRGMETGLAEEKNRARRSGKPIVVVLIDCDNFKQINEDHGHSGGDETLRVVAARMRLTMRSTDHYCRVGGDEFLIACPETDLQASRPLLERLLAAIANEPIGFGSAQINVTVSAGAAELPADMSSVDDILKLTRQSLQGSKITGKNKVQFAGEPTAQEPVV